MSFVTENSRLSGYKTCIEALKHPMYTWLRSHTWLEHCSMLDSCGHCPLNLTTPSSWDQKKQDCFDWYFVLSAFKVWSRSSVVLFPHPKHVVWKGLENLEMVLYFGLVFYLSSSPSPDPQEVLSVSSMAQTQDGCRPIPIGRLSGVVSLCVSCVRKSRSTCGLSGTLFFSCALATAAAIFINFTKLEKKNSFKLLLFHSLLSELWSPALLLKTSTNTPVCLPPFLLFFFLLPSSRILFPPQSREWAGLSLVWHHWVFPMPLPQSCSDVRQISLQWPHSHCLYSLIDAGMLEVTHESESVFHAYPWHPIEAAHRVCVWVWRPAPCGPVLVHSLLRSPLHLLMECCFEMLTLYKHNRKCKKKIKTHTRKPIWSVFVYTHVRTSIPK